MICAICVIRYYGNTLPVLFCRWFVLLMIPLICYWLWPVTIIVAILVTGDLFGDFVFSILFDTNLCPFGDWLFLVIVRRSRYWWWLSGRWCHSITVVQVSSVVVVVCWFGVVRCIHRCRCVAITSICWLWSSMPPFTVIHHDLYCRCFALLVTITFDLGDCYCDLLRCSAFALHIPPYHHWLPLFWHLLIIYSFPLSVRCELCLAVDLPTFVGYCLLLSDSAGPRVLDDIVYLLFVTGRGEFIRFPWPLLIYSCAVGWRSFYVRCYRYLVPFEFYLWRRNSLHCWNAVRYRRIQRRYDFLGGVVLTDYRVSTVMVVIIVVPHHYITDCSFGDCSIVTWLIIPVTHLFGWDWLLRLNPSHYVVVIVLLRWIFCCQMVWRLFCSWWLLFITLITYCYLMYSFDGTVGRWGNYDCGGVPVCDARPFCLLVVLLVFVVSCYRPFYMQLRWRPLRCRCYWYHSWWSTFPTNLYFIHLYFVLFHYCYDSCWWCGDYTLLLLLLTLGESLFLFWMNITQFVNVFWRLLIVMSAVILRCSANYLGNWIHWCDTVVVRYSHWCGGVRRWPFDLLMIVWYAGDCCCTALRQAFITFICYCVLTADTYDSHWRPLPTTFVIYCLPWLLFVWWRLHSWIFPYWPTLPTFVVTPMTTFITFDCRVAFHYYTDLRRYSRCRHSFGIAAHFWPFLHTGWWYRHCCGQYTGRTCILPPDCRADYIVYDYHQVFVVTVVTWMICLIPVITDIVVDRACDGGGVTYLLYCCWWYDSRRGIAVLPLFRYYWYLCWPLPTLLIPVEFDAIPTFALRWIPGALFGDCWFIRLHYVGTGALLGRWWLPVIDSTCNLFIINSVCILIYFGRYDASPTLTGAVNCSPQVWRPFSSFALQNRFPTVIRFCSVPGDGEDMIGGIGGGTFLFVTTIVVGIVVVDANWYCCDELFLLFILLSYLFMRYYSALLMGSGKAPVGPDLLLMMILFCWLHTIHKFFDLMELFEAIVVIHSGVCDSSIVICCDGICWRSLGGRHCYLYCSVIVYKIRWSVHCI